MGQFYGAGAGHDFVVGGPVFDLQFVFTFLKQHARPHERHMEQHIDFIEGQPIVNAPFVPVKDHLAVMQVGINHTSVFPAAVFFDEGDGRIKMANRNERLDAVFAAFIDQAVIEGETGLVGDRIIAVGQDARPCDGKTVDLETHLSKQGDILFVVMIQIDGLVGGIAVFLITGQHFHLPAGDLHSVGTKGDHIYRGKAASIDIVSAFTLVGGGGTAPQKVFGEGTHTKNLLDMYCKQRHGRDLHDHAVVFAIPQVTAWQGENQSSLYRTSVPARAMTKAKTEAASTTHMLNRPVLPASI